MTFKKNCRSINIRVGYRVRRSTNNRGKSSFRRPEALYHLQVFGPNWTMLIRPSIRFETRFEQKAKNKNPVFETMTVVRKVLLSSSSSMASSNNSIAENKKSKNTETSTPTSKIKKERDIEKSKEKKKNSKNKKLKLSNGNSKEHEEDKGKQREHEVEEGGGEGEEEAKTHVFPMNRIRTILKGEISDLRVSQEAILAINKATVTHLFTFFLL